MYLKTLFNELNTFTKIESEVENEFNVGERAAFLKDDVDVRIESLKTVLEELRKTLYDEIDKNVKEIG